MPQPRRRSGTSTRKRSTSGSAGSKRGTAAKRRPSSTAKRTTSTAQRKSQPAKRSAAAAKRGSTGKRSTTKRATTTRKRATKARRSTSPRARSAGGPGDVAAKAVQEFRDALQRGTEGRLNFAILTRERIEEVMNEAVERGRVTADDAQSVVQSLLDRARKETTDVVRDLEGLVKRGRDEVETRGTAARKRGESAAMRARRQVEDASKGVRSRAVKTGDPALAQVDRVRRAAGVGPSFPVLGYDDLTANQVRGRLTDLTPAELRKVRDYEKRNANRESVLKAIGSKLD